MINSKSRRGGLRPSAINKVIREYHGRPKAAPTIIHRIPSSATRTQAMKAALLLGNGEPPGAELFLREAQKADIFICADGAAEFALEHGVWPTMAVGDFDSLDADVLTKLREHGVEIETHPAEKVDTDKMNQPSFLMVMTAGQFAYRRPDGVYVVPIGCMKD